MAAAGCITGQKGDSFCEINGTKGPDDHLMTTSVETVGILANFTKSTGRPFFLGVGFHKPQSVFRLFFPFCIRYVLLFGGRGSYW